jgi:hypothetical protein
LLEKLKLAREKALQKKREIKELKDGEKAIKQKELEDRKKRVEEFTKLTRQEADFTKAEFKKSMPPEHDESSSESDEEVEHQIVVKKAPKKAKKKIIRKVIEVSSSSSDSDSSDDEDYKEQLKNKYKMKYKSKYKVGSCPHTTKAGGYVPQRDVLKEQASDVIRSNVSKELRKIALESVFPTY